MCGAVVRTARFAWGVVREGGLLGGLGVGFGSLLWVFGGGEFEELAQRCLVFVVRFKSVVLLICIFPVDEYGSRLGAE